MRQFIPFEDDWDLLETLGPDDLIPYRRGLLDVPAAADQSAAFAANAPAVGVEVVERMQSGSRGAHDGWNFQRKM